MAVRQICDSKALNDAQPKFSLAPAHVHPSQLRSQTFDDIEIGSQPKLATQAHKVAMKLLGTYDMRDRTNLITLLSNNM